MRRLLTGFLVVAAVLGLIRPALAQSSGKVWRLGVLTTSATGPPFETLRSVTFPELAKQGFVEGRNLAVEARAGPPDKLPELARELAATRPDVVIAVSSWAIQAMRQTSSSTPVVGSFIGSDPIAAGFATSLARPGGNVTGIVMLAPELDAKRVDILHEALPQARRVAALVRSKQLEASALAEMEKAASQAGLELLAIDAAAPDKFAVAQSRGGGAGDRLGARVREQFRGARLAGACFPSADYLRVGLDGAGRLPARLRPGFHRAAPPHRRLCGPHLSWHVTR